MAITLLFFISPRSFGDHVERELAETKSALLVHTEKLVDARRRYEELTLTIGEKNKNRQTGNSLGNMKRVELAGLKVLINPTPNYELSILDEAIASLQEKLEALEKIKKDLLPGLKNCDGITVILEDGIPTAFTCRESN